MAANGMSANQELQRIFDQLASGLEILEGGSFRVTSHRRIARFLRDMTMDLQDFVAREPSTADKRLQELPGIGKGAARRILEFLETGELEEHQKLLTQVPPGLFDLLEIPGIGPKAAQLLWKELQVESLEDLKALLEQGGIEELPRMGKKTVENLKRALDFARRSDRIPIGAARPIADSLLELLGSVPGVQKLECTGSLRRGKDTIGDLDLLAATKQPEPLREAFLELPEVTQVLARGETKCSVRMSAQSVTLQVDLRIVPAGVWGAALMYFTGSKDHNVRLREISIKQKRLLNEYGLFEGTEERPQDSGQKPIAARSEKQIYRKLGLAFVPPELREDRGELDGFPTDLVTLESIKSELHSHTTASDGKLNLEQLAQEAQARGFHTLAVTDHSKSSVLANGLDSDRLKRHIEKIRELNERLEDLVLLAGSEVDILPDGALDYEDDLLAELDLVVASPHISLRQDRRTATQRLVRAASHPAVDILGHPTGRQIGKREGLPIDVDQVCAAAAANHTALEINANPRRLDLRDTHVRTALEHGCKIAINTDAHSPRHFDLLSYGVITGRRGFLGRSNCLNCWSAKKLSRWLASRRS